MIQRSFSLILLGVAAWTRLLAQQPDAQVRQSVVSSLAEAQQIGNTGLRNYIYDSAARFLAAAKAKRLEDLPAIKQAGWPQLKNKTRADEVHTITRIAVAFNQDMLDHMPAYKVSKDAVIDAALRTQPLVGYLLIAGVILTGLYIGRLFAIVYLAPAADAHAVHHDLSSERLMNWSLVPLMVGAIGLGWLGFWLIGQLNASLGDVEPFVVISVSGLSAFALGAIGFGAACWYVLRQPAQAAQPGTTDTSYSAAADA